MKKIIFLIFGGILTASCVEDATIQIKNDVSNCILTELNFDGNNLYGGLISGQSTSTIIEDEKENWPKSGRISFVMVANAKQIYLQTKATYILDAGDKLMIVISDTTQVENP